MDGYELNRAVEPFVGFIDQLTNWYIRRNRSRFWDEEASCDRDEAFETLLHCSGEPSYDCCAIHPVLQRSNLPAT